MRRSVAGCVPIATLILSVIGCGGAATKPSAPESDTVPSASAVPAQKTASPIGLPTSATSTPSDETKEAPTMKKKLRIALCGIQEEVNTFAAATMGTAKVTGNMATGFQKTPRETKMFSYGRYREPTNMLIWSSRKWSG